MDSFEVVICHVAESFAAGCAAWPACTLHAPTCPPPPYLPPPGCEADAIAFTQEASQLFTTDPGTSSSDAPPTVGPDGSYAAGPADVAALDAIQAAFEACLVLAPMQRRLRVVHNLQRMGAEGAWQLDNVELHSERWVGWVGG